MFDAILHPFAWAISYVWVWIHDLLVLLGMSSGSGMAWVLSIVLLTVLVRIAIIPLFLKQIRSSRAMQAIQPEMRKIQEKYKGKKDQVSRQKMMEETQALQRKHKVSPFASCLPMLVQMPVLFGMYRAIIAVSSISAGTYTYRGDATDHLGPLTESVSSEIVNSTVFGVQLSHTLRDSWGQTGAVTVFISAIVLMVVLQFASMRLSFSRNMPDMGDNPMAQSQRSMMYVMPLMFIFSGAFFQMGVVIYTVTASFWALAQSFWTIKVMPTPGSPAYADLLSSRESAYQEWAKPYFQNYDRERAALGNSATDPRVDELNERTLTEVRSKAKKQHVASDFPASMTTGEIVTVYRNLATQKWTTLPDEQWMHGLALAVEGAAVGDLTIAQAHVGQSLLVVDRGDGQGGLVRGGFAERARVGVGREWLVLARVVAVCVGEGVAARGVDGDASGIQLLIHPGEDAARVAAHAGVVTQGQVDDVGLDDERVVEGCQQGAVGHRAVLVRGDLRDDDLRVGRGALQNVRVGGRDRGDVSAVGQVLLGMGNDVGVVVRVVEDEGDLLIEVGTGLAVRQLADEGLDVPLAQAHVDAVHGAGERLVGGLDARVDDLDDLTITLEGDLVRARHRQGRGVLEDGRTAALCRILQRLVDAFDERGLHALDLSNRPERGAGCLDGKAVERVRVVAHGRDLRAGDDSLHRGSDAGLHGVVRGLRGATGCSILQLDDDRRRGIVGLLLRGRGVGQGHSPSLGLADGQHSVLDSRPRLRVR